MFGFIDLMCIEILLMFDLGGILWIYVVCYCVWMQYLVVVDVGVVSEIEWDVGGGLIFDGEVFFQCCVIQCEVVEVVGEYDYVVVCQLVVVGYEQGDVIVLYVEIFGVFGVGEGWWIDVDYFVVIVFVVQEFYGVGLDQFVCVVGEVVQCEVV